MPPSIIKKSSSLLERDQGIRKGKKGVSDLSEHLQPLPGSDLSKLSIATCRTCVWLQFTATEELASDSPGRPMARKPFGFKTFLLQAPSPPLPAEACQLKPHRHLPDGALLHFKQELAKSQWGPCSHAPSAHKQKGEIPDWQLSWLETFRDVFSAYSCSVLT